MKIGENAIYFICISIGATAFQVYSEGLNNLNWAFAGFIFSLISWLSVKFLHNPTRKLLSKLNNFKEGVIVKEKKWSGLTKNEVIAVVLLGLLSFGNLALLLPFLKNQEIAIYYTIIGSALVRIISIYVAQKLFNDQIGNKILFWLGFIICIIGIFLFKYNNFINGTINYLVIVFSLIWGCMSIISDQLKRYITIDISERKWKIPYFYKVSLNIKTLQEKSEFTKTGLFFIVVTIFFGLNKSFVIIPNFKEIGSLLWIGYVVTIFGGTIAMELKNKIGETIGSILQSSRVMSSMIYAPIIVYILSSNDPFVIWLDLWKWIGVLLIFAGSTVGLVLGKPSREKFLKPFI